MATAVWIAKEHIMNRKPIFDAVRALLGRGFSQAEVERIDRAIDQALCDDSPLTPPATATVSATHRLGALSEQFESGGRGPGAVSSGRGDPGGVSYGVYQLSSRMGVVAAFLANEGRAWRTELAGGAPGSEAFSAAWKAIAAREADAFAEAQHGFIQRTHYQPAVNAVAKRTGLDLDARHPAVRDVVWSVAVQHGGAAGILADAIARADAAPGRDDPGYDRALIEAIYAVRADYVRGVAGRSPAGARATLESVVRKRYPAELAAALAQFA